MGLYLRVLSMLWWKPSLDTSVLSNFRLVSKLPFLSKVLEKVVYCNIILDNILEVIQSGFKTHHSTESALLKVSKDILLDTDSGHCFVLILLDLTTVQWNQNHEILLSQQENWVGIQRCALEWFRSYLKGRIFLCLCWSCWVFCSSSHMRSQKPKKVMCRMGNAFQT